MLSVPLFRRCVCADLAGGQLSDFKLRSVTDFGKNVSRAFECCCRMRSTGILEERWILHYFTEKKGTENRLFFYMEMEKTVLILNIRLNIFATGIG